MNDRKESISKLIESLLGKGVPDMLLMPWSAAEEMYARLGIKLEDVIQPAPTEDEDGRD